MSSVSTDIDKISEHLYISNWYASQNPEVLEVYNIKAVLTLEMTEKSRDILDYYKQHGIDFLQVYINDSPDEKISTYFDYTYDFINEHISLGNNVLVHCAAGISRSATIIINYLLRKIYETEDVRTCPCKLLQNIIQFMRKSRPKVNPNSGFQSQLLMRAMIYQQEIGK